MMMMMMMMNSVWVLCPVEIQGALFTGCSRTSPAEKNTNTQFVTEKFSSRARLRMFVPKVTEVKTPADTEYPEFKYCSTSNTPALYSQLQAGKQQVNSVTVTHQCKNLTLE